MNILKSVELMKKYSSCLQCGNDKIGNGAGKLHIEEDTFYRSCKCGWKIKTDEDGNLIE